MLFLLVSMMQPFMIISSRMKCAWLGLGVRVRVGVGVRVGVRVRVHDHLVQDEVRLG